MKRVNLCAVNTIFYFFYFFLLFLHLFQFPTYFSILRSFLSLCSVQFSLHPWGPAQLWLIIKAIFLHLGWIMAMEYLTKQLSCNCHHLFHLFFFYCKIKASYDLHDIKIEWSKFRYSSWVHPKYTSDELRPKIIIKVIKYALASLLTSAEIG